MEEREEREGRECGDTSSQSEEIPSDSVRRCSKSLLKDMVAFFILGIIIALPTMVLASAADSMFPGFTGLMAICMAVAAAVTTFTAPMFIHLLPHNFRVLTCFVASMLSNLFCIIGKTIAGPAIGNVLAGFVYAFGTTVYLSAAAFFDQRTVIAFSTGSGFSALVGPTLYIGFTQAFNDNWQRALLHFLPFAFVQPLVWFTVLPARNRIDAEQTRQAARNREAERFRSHQAAENHMNPGVIEPESSSINELVMKTGFGPGRTRIGLFGKTIFPLYVVPLLTCSCGAMFLLTGLAPTFTTLDTFRGAPGGELNYQLDFLFYGAAQFLSSGFAMFYKSQVIWFWTLAQLFIVATGIIQLFYPFLTHYSVWLVCMFATGGILGGGVANTNYKIANDFLMKGESADVRAFAMSYGGLGNFAGDVLGGGLAILVQRLALEHLAPHTESPTDLCGSWCQKSPDILKSGVYPNNGQVYLFAKTAQVSEI